MAFAVVMCMSAVDPFYATFNPAQSFFAGIWLFLFMPGFQMFAVSQDTLKVGWLGLF